MIRIVGRGEEQNKVSAQQCRLCHVNWVPVLCFQSCGTQNLSRWLVGDFLLQSANCVFHRDLWYRRRQSGSQWYAINQGSGTTVLRGNNSKRYLVRESETSLTRNEQIKTGKTQYSVQDRIWLMRSLYVQSSYNHTKCNSWQWLGFALSISYRLIRYCLMIRAPYIICDWGCTPYWRSTDDVNQLYFCLP